MSSGRDPVASEWFCECEGGANLRRLLNGRNDSNLPQDSSFRDFWSLWEVVQRSFRVGEV